ncbi:hypothetical protein AbraCBS73388_004822 [Aspergillus brasiliensis]|uniref:Mitochondrial thiamine pyrophosphate carrier 1 n=1 Tax=Aspergillus brasiliensis TaxID=319629 RepID=A0A9W5Z4K8_9EURO|nr:hypothetical protein AbraCBS73388_004822 [Aspergillus brasiliensis]
MATSENDKRPKPSSLRSIIAGSTAGAVEIAITYPAEFAKTRSQLNRRLPDAKKLPWPPFGAQWIDDRKSQNPRMRGFLHGSKVIFQERGVRGFFQGFVPTTARQAANSATRFSSYTMLKQMAQGYVAPGEKLGTASTFALGGIAGLITVYAYPTPRTLLTTIILRLLCGSYVTQPLDTVKTRMQSLEASKNYKNSFVCAARIFKDEGFFTFWSGAVPRLARLIMSGGIVFTMYEKTMDALDGLDPERRYL